MIHLGIMNVLYKKKIDYINNTINIISINNTEYYIKKKLDESL